MRWVETDAGFINMGLVFRIYVKQEKDESWDVVYEINETSYYPLFVTSFSSKMEACMALKEFYRSHPGIFG